MKRIFFAASVLVILVTVSAKKDKHHGKFFEDFKKSSSRYFNPNHKESGTDLRYEFASESKSEQGTTILKFMIDPDDPAGAGKGPEIVSKNFTHFGTYAARIKVPDVSKIQPNVGAVVGYFTYHMDSDPGLSEIDYEWLIADPEIIYIGTWTGPRGKLERIGRTLNLATGTIYSTSYRAGHEGERIKLEGAQNQPETVPAIEGYNAAKQFYTYGFDWYPNRLRWWIIHPRTADTVILWDYQGSQLGIPQNHTKYRLNFWHTNNWPVQTNPNSIEKPLDKYELEIDWMSYEPYKIKVSK
ncbi:MAG: beta-glucanase/beta-glucan synthetase [Bacteroidetes bacterium GWE2_41_25]|nr:MAG: beta-glucanase/beta-glucan synthetase [Bacteroidetes bacterium GWA2_40_15]OFX95119.1 MAG: beta-glucanase/beta-glucan synthetase [Bacteroidetes bacterium GWC2_40_22]OFX95411.1 MAG: beta-glucanase/beta-glucan synthetase [Bacteroidetes bacterium GWE2_41_25]OFY57341.1 MAG: beta-glucanase/beta-glucan synthetase [Bacteroidetes bacterium GWF2_41_9]HAM10562.1 beta-glucanase/beta-glucan synthetase [Bacteroidales bacterium]